ncbi:MAG: acyl-CoA dehydrogenase [Alphaproteobacteria bacterium]
MSEIDILSDEQRMIRESAEGFVAKDSGIDRVRKWRWQAPGFDRAVWRTMVSNGWLGLTWPEAHGGLGMGLGSLGALVEVLGSGLVPEPLIAASVLGAGSIVHGDNQALQQSLLPRIANGEVIPALAWQEGPDGLECRPATRAESKGGVILLRGTKTHVPAAGGADGFVVSAWDGVGVGLYWVERGAAGLSMDLAKRVDGGFYGTLTFDGVTVEPGGCVASAKTGEAVLARVLDEARLMASASLLGNMSKALEISLEYMRNRVQFDKPIGSFQALQHRAVDLYVQQELSRSAVMAATQVFESTTDARARAVAASQAKARCSDAGLRITRECIQIHGGIGYTDECNIGLYLKRAMVEASWLGNASAHRRRYAALNPAAA